MWIGKNPIPPRTSSTYYRSLAFHSFSFLFPFFLFPGALDFRQSGKEISENYIGNFFKIFYFEKNHFKESLLIALMYYIFEHLSLPIWDSFVPGFNLIMKKMPSSSGYNVLLKKFNIGLWTLKFPSPVENLQRTHRGPIDQSYSRNIGMSPCWVLSVSVWNILLSRGALAKEKNRVKHAHCHELNSKSHSLTFDIFVDLL